MCSEFVGNSRPERPRRAPVVLRISVTEASQLIIKLC